MEDGEIDFASYTLRDLEDMFARIDRERYPKNYANLRAAYQHMTSQPEPEPEPEPEPDMPATPPDEAATPTYHPPVKLRYTPNKIVRGERVIAVLGTMFLLGYGAWGLMTDGIYLPGARGRRPHGMHLHGLSAWVMFGAFLCLAAVMLSAVVDHYDERDNEASYKTFTSWSTALMLALFALAVAMHIGATP